MLTKLTLKNFKRFESAEIELARSVVFIGPNNSGKTTALQALALWQVGLKALLAKRSADAQPGKRPGVTINRLDLNAIPVPVANLLWHDRKFQKSGNAKIRIEILAEGIWEGKPWAYGLEFDYTNEESILCRPLREKGHEESKVSDAKFMPMPDGAQQVAFAYLPPMSGLADREFIHHPGTLATLIGQGQTSQVLRNLCHRLRTEIPEEWEKLVAQMRALFNIALCDPQFVPEHGLIEMRYLHGNVELDLSSAGRGQQQTLLLLTYLKLHQKTVLLLDEPDAHLEILRQKEIYSLLGEEAARHGSQILMASHSEVVLNEACERDHPVVAFTGQPHTLNKTSKGHFVRALTEVGWDKYYLAEKNGWMLFLEDATDHEILRAFAEVLKHPAAEHLQRPFVHHLGHNQPQDARIVFHALLEAKPDLRGLILLDHVDKNLNNHPSLREVMWERREIENYFCQEAILLRYAQGHVENDLFSPIMSAKRVDAMKASIDELVQAKRVASADDSFDPWGAKIKATDDFLDPLFRNYSKRLGMPLELRKRDYRQLALLARSEELNPEVTRILDLIVDVAKSAKAR